MRLSFPFCQHFVEEKSFVLCAKNETFKFSCQPRATIRPTSKLASAKHLRDLIHRAPPSPQASSRRPEWQLWRVSSVQPRSRMRRRSGPGLPNPSMHLVIFDHTRISIGSEFHSLSIYVGHADPDDSCVRCSYSSH